MWQKVLTELPEVEEGRDHTEPVFSRFTESDLDLGLKLLSKEVVVLPLWPSLSASMADYFLSK